MIGPGPDTEAIQGIIQGTDIIETKAEAEIEDKGLGLSQETGKLRCRSSSHVSTNRDRLRCYRCNEYDHFARECPNIMSDEDSDQDNSEGATLQLLTQEEQTKPLCYSELDDLNI